MFDSTFYGQSMTLKIAFSNPRFTKDFVRKGLICVYYESTDNSKEDYFS